MATLPSTDTPKTDQLDPEPKNKKVWKDLKNQRDACKNYRRKLVATWTASIDYRRAKPFASQTDEDRIAVPVDWQMTKEKESQLFSQLPSVRVDHSPQTIDKNVMPWIHNYEQKINDTLANAGIENVLEEIIPDCVNASGIGIAMASYEVITEQVSIPSVDTSMMDPQMVQQGVMADGSPIPMQAVPRIVDSRYSLSRVSPADFLWPISFNGSDFDKSPWLGRSGRLTWAEGSVRFNLNEADKQAVLGEDRTSMDRLTHDIDKDKIDNQDLISFDEIFYREFQFDTDAKNFSAIHHVVFVNGKDDPVIDEPWKGQRQDPTTQKLIGVMSYPIKVLTLTYITDEAIPPSDSAVSRTQVNELNKSRTQMILQRERSLPVRWFDVNRVDPVIQQNLMRGVYQGMIPVQGQGANIIGEVARASTSPENFKFDEVIQNDIRDTWGTGVPGSGAGIETKGEASDIQDNMRTRIGRERAKVGKFFCSIAEVIGGLICLYEDPASFGDGFNPSISTTLKYSILADATLLLDAQQRIKRLVDFLNFAGKSGWVNVEPVLKEIATLSGLDPNAVIQPPAPKPPTEPNISLRLTGTEDMLNPLTLAFLINSGQAPSQELIEKAKQLIQTAVMPPPNAVQMPPLPPEPGQEPSPDGSPDQGAGPAGPPPAGPPPPPPTGPPAVPTPIGPPLPVQIPGPPPPTTGAAHPDWHAFPRVNDRVIDRK